ncbi:HlyD family secretion protein [Oleiharenicola sp. Vm1]|jgi:membrane fusion protein (multidrug efflux system)|uniref:HlyD family secretion protein n=1 Tax=Oleiharenicola sp. Vm1 TaxID=3398393 RepID=UPI0039F494A3
MESSHKTHKPARKGLRRVLMLGSPVVAIFAGLVIYLHGGRVISSDNAYVHAEKLTLTTEVAGSVVEIAVRDNEVVKAGQLLCRIDDSVYRNEVDGARAQLEAARTEIATLRASHRQKLAQIAEAKELVAYAERELTRQQTLASGDVGTEAELDKARHTLDAARNRVEVLEHDAATVLASLGGSIDQPDEKYARVAAAQARLATAERNLGKTVLRAPFAGITTNVSNIALGKLLAAGQPAFSLVGTERAWLEANLKETELTYVKVGDPVTAEIDAYPRHFWHGRVTAIGPATGAEFSLIPAQNAAGNWVKVVQRVPVRIELDTVDAEHPLRAGMSAEVEIDTGHVRHLRDLLPSHVGG